MYAGEDDLELLEEYDLEHDSDDSRSDGERGVRDDAYEDEAHANTPEEVEAAINEVKGTVVEVVSALGGLEDVEVEGKIETVYVLGDDCLRCLRDLRRLWREGGDDPNRIIAHVFSQVGVLQNLIPLLLKTAGGDERSSKISLACVDLLTSITWPIDAQAEMRAAKARGEDASQLAHLIALEQSMVAYKAAVLRTRLGESRGDSASRDTLGCVMRYVLLPSLSKHRSQRTERDSGTIAMSLHLFRNLLAIRDPLATTLSSNEQIAESTLQSDLVCAMARTHVLETLLMLANGADKAEFNQWNVVTADCIFAVYGGERAAAIASPSTSGKGNESGAASSSTASSSSTAQLRSFLDAEARQRRNAAPSSSRHSRFGTTLSFYTTNGDRRVARTQNALRKSVSELRRDNDQRSRRKFRRRTKVNEAGAPRVHAEWTKPAREALQDWADRFLLSSGFETLTRSVLKDIASEREKVGDLDEARVKVMLLGAFFLDWFRVRRCEEDEKLAATLTPATENAAPGESSTPVVQPPRARWSFALLDSWLQEWSFKMVLVRSLDSLESKHWLELSAAVQLWMSLLRLVEHMSRKGDEAAQEGADHLLANHFYHAETLKVCLSIGRCYTTQSMEFLDVIVAFLTVMPRMLEKYSQDKEHLFVRAKKARQKRKDNGEDNEDDDAAPRRAEDLYIERRVSFTRFQSSLATRPLVEACVGYLCKWRDFTRPVEQLSNVVAILHRIAIKAGDVRAFFPAHIRVALAGIEDKGELYAAMQPVAPRAAGDAKKLVQYCLKKFEKLDKEEKELWQQGKKPPKPPKAVKLPREVEVKPGFPRDSCVGIAVGLLAEQGHLARVSWVKSALEIASQDRLDVIKSTDGPMWREALRQGLPDGNEEALEQAVARSLAVEPPSAEALSLVAPHSLPYWGDAPLQHDATTLPALKLVCRLLGLESDEDDDTCWQWRIPADVLPGDLEADVKLMDRFLEAPFELPYGAERYEDLVQPARKKVAKKPQATVAVRAEQGEVSGSDSDESTAASSSDDHEELGGKRRRGHRRRKDLAGDSRKRKGFRRRAPVGANQGFLGEGDMIDSDEEEQIERMWRAQNSGAGASSPVSSARPSRSPVAAGRVSTPPTSPPREEGERRPKNKSKALFLGSDVEDSDADDDHDLPQRSRQSSTRSSLSLSPYKFTPSPQPAARKRTAAVLSSEDEDDEDERPMSRATFTRKYPAFVGQDSDVGTDDEDVVVRVRRPTMMEFMNRADDDDDDD